MGHILKQYKMQNSNKYQFVGGIAETEAVPIPRQPSTDKTSCGGFLLLYARPILRGETPKFNDREVRN